MVWHGFVTAYTPEVDAEDGREDIAVRTNRSLIEFHEEIRSIKVVKDERE